MHGIKLHFSSSAAAPELFRLEFFHPLAAEKIVSVRGKSGGAALGGESFQWTPAVKALSILLLRARISADSAAAPQAKCDTLTKELLRAISLEGDPGTPASSLDNALSKEPIWLVELFGRDSNGSPLCRRLFRRTNPDRRFPGPVAVGLNGAVWDGLAIAVENNGKPAGGEELSTLLGRVEQGFKTYDRSKQAGRQRSENCDTVPAPVRAIDGYTPLQRILHGCYLNEITESLAGIDIFNRQTVRQLVSAVSENESFVRVAGGPQPIVSPVDLDLSAAGRLGMCKTSESRLRAHCDQRPLNVACGVALFGALSLFEHLRFKKGHRIAVDYEFPHAVEIVRHLLAGRFDDLPDILILGIPPAATLISHPLGEEYRPFMLMPSVSQKIVAPLGEATSSVANGADRFAELNHGRFLLMGDDPSHPSFLFDALKRRGFARSDKIISESLEPDETVRELSAGDPDTRAILFFPYYDINRIFNGCGYLANPVAGLGIVMAMMHRRVAEDENLVRALDVAVRDSWLKLRESALERELLVRRFIGDEKFVRAVSRFGGLHNLNLPESNETILYPA